jgi:hypothetical protein
MTLAFLAILRDPRSILRDPCWSWADRMIGTEVDLRHGCAGGTLCRRHANLRGRCTPPAVGAREDRCPTLAGMTGARRWR